MKSMFSIAVSLLLTLILTLGVTASPAQLMAPDDYPNHGVAVVFDSEHQEYHENLTVKTVKIDKSINVEALTDAEIDALLNPLLNKQLGPSPFMARAHTHKWVNKGYSYTIYNGTRCRVVHYECSVCAIWQYVILYNG